MGVPGSGKTTTAHALAEHYEVKLIHGSKIVQEACRGIWESSSGTMAPEPQATIAIEMEVAKYGEFILDGFPRSERQLRAPFVEADTVVYLDLTNPQALIRALSRARNTPEIEEMRIEEQARLLTPVKSMAAVIVPVYNRTEREVTQAVIDWYDHNIHPVRKL